MTDKINKNEKENNKSEKIQEIKEWIIAFAIALIIAFSIRFFIFETVIVKQSSMYPTLNPDDRLGLFKLSYTISEPQQGDIIVIKITDKKNYVKRLIATENQTVEIRNSVVYVDGVALDEEYISDDIVYDDFDMITVPEGYIFVLGDNRVSSIDSRSLGCLPENDIIGKVVIRFNPLTFF